MYVFSMTNEEMEDSADSVKAAILCALVKDGLIEEGVAESWAERTTVLHRKKSIFRTLSDKWRKAETKAGDYYYIVVSRK